MSLEEDKADDIMMILWRVIDTIRRIEHQGIFLNVWI